MSSFPSFVSAGEALTDLVRTGPAQWTSLTGGAPLNVARAMARLGVPSAFAGAVSNDVFGQALQASTAQAGLDMRFLQVRQKPPLLAVVAETSPPDYFFIGEDSADLHFRPEELPEAWETKVSWVHFGGISLARAPLAQRLIALAASIKEHGVRISYDPNFRKLMDAHYDVTLCAMMRVADVVKVSDEDLQGLFRTADTADALRQLRALNPQAAILFTRGGAGAELLVGKQVWRAAAPKIDVVDTIGAGDASITALLYSLMHTPQENGAEHLRFAVAAGAAACVQAGATPPTLEQIAALVPAVHVTLLDGTH